MNAKKLQTIFKRKWTVLMLMAVMTAAGTACTTAATPSTSGETAVQVESSEGGGEAGGEHGAGGEGSEGGNGSGEAGEGSNNSPSHTEEGSGVNALALNETFDTVNSGARLILNYDAASNNFVGTVENVSNVPLTRVRIEIHLSNGTELGPTTPTDMAPGEILDLVIPATAQAFDSWDPHAEVGASDSVDSGESGMEGGGEGSESGSEGSSEGAGGEGHGAGGEGSSESGLETLMSSPVTPNSKSWSGNLGGLDITGSYDANARTFTTVATNTLPSKLCYVLTEPHLKMGTTTVGELGPGVIGDLNPGETKTLVIDLANETGLTGVNFDGYAMHMEVYACSGPGPDGGAPTINPLTGQPGSGEGSNEGSGGESDGEGGSEGAGGEGSGEHGGEGGEGGGG